MKKSSSLLRSVFNTQISSITGLGIVGFLGLSLTGLVVFGNFDTGSVIHNNPLLSQSLGIPTVSAQVFMPGLQMPLLRPVVLPEKEIFISLKDQTLTYKEGHTIIGEFKISSGLRYTPTPPGEYTVLKKKPVVDYIGTNYSYPRTKWNLMFKTGWAGQPLNYYIHGAPWHNNFGKPMSHGCINVSYANMEGLYNWADEGTKVHIQ
jgi:hypothetical protein